MEIEKRLKKCEEEIVELKKKVSGILGENHSRGLEKNLSQKKESPREFYIRYSPKTDTEKTLVIIGFLEKEGIENITTKKIAEGFREMREPHPKNISDKIQLLDKRAFLVKKGQSDNRHCWILSNSGENFLEKMKNG